jgi:pSer/pThr/pTyr-binding forkhead associated (FHA) protein/S1-C subfamily serine protease
MPYLRLRDLKSSEEREFESAAVRVGRDPTAELPILGEAAKVVSGSQARFVYEAGVWWVEDLGSLNGTYLDERRLAARARVAVDVGGVVGFGEGGPRLRVEAAAAQRPASPMRESPTPPVDSSSESTLRMDTPDLATRSPRPLHPAESPFGSRPVAPPFSQQELQVVLREARTGQRYEGRGGRIRIGRGQECELRPVGPGDTAVSRVHAEIVLKPNGEVVVRDTKSRNGTIVNGQRLVGEHLLALGDQLLLGQGGPDLLIEEMVVAGVSRAPGPGLGRPDTAPGAKQPIRRSFGGKGATLFFRELMAETDRSTRRRIRVIVWSFVGLLALATGGIYWWSGYWVRQTAAQLESEQREALAAQRRAADSVRQAAQSDYERLRTELDSARSRAAPASVVESLRTALSEASRRTTALEASLQRATVALNQQIAAGDSLRRQAQAELSRLRGALSQANGGGVSNETVDSLRRAVLAAEDRANSIDARLRAVKGVDLAALSQANQGAVGLVTGFGGGGSWNGSGFVITQSGYFVTNRHVAMAEREGADSSVQLVPADSLFVTMADRRLQDWVHVTVVSVSPPGQPDLAVLRIPNYSGPYIAKVDWDGNSAQQGEPAALIGFPTGEALAYDYQTRTVRTSMSAGIISKVTADRIQFDGFTVGGSSGSPVFNANGEVVAVHAAGLREAAGLGLAVPVKYVLPLLSPDARAELGLR